MDRAISIDATVVDSFHAEAANNNATHSASIPPALLLLPSDDAKPCFIVTSSPCCAGLTSKSRLSILRRAELNGGDMVSARRRLTILNNKKISQ